jgi:CRISPR/Cas system-associated endonuclease Cas1
MVQLRNVFNEGIILAKEFIKGGIKNLLDANSILSKNKNSTNSSTDSESNSEK